MSETQMDIPVIGIDGQTIFSDFISGNKDCYKIYEDEYTFCFLSNYPDRIYHALVIPKITIDHVIDIPEPYYSKLYLTVQKISKALLTVSGAERIYQYVEGFQVAHAHVHIYPVNSANDIEKNFEQGTQLSNDMMLRMQEEIINAIKQLP